MMFGWSAEQVTEITMEEVDLEFTPSVTNTERRVTNLEFVLQQKHAALMALTSYEANDIVASSRKNPLEVEPTTNTSIQPISYAEAVADSRSITLCARHSPRSLHVCSENLGG